MTTYVTDVTLLYVNISPDLIASTVFRDNRTGQIFEVPGGPITVIGVLEDEGQSPKEQAEGDQVDPAGTPAEGSEPEAHSGDDPEQEVQGDGHSLSITLSGGCLHGITWEGMNYSHWAMHHKEDHP